MRGGVPTTQALRHLSGAFQASTRSSAAALPPFLLQRAFRPKCPISLILQASRQPKRNAHGRALSAAIMPALADKWGLRVSSGAGKPEAPRGEDHLAGEKVTGIVMMVDVLLGLGKRQRLIPRRTQRAICVLRLFS